MGHERRIERAFTAQAQAFEDPAHNRVFTADSAWVFDALPLDEAALVLDVAAGTGHAARQLARRARAVVALDATAAMLERGQHAAAAEGVTNVVFMRGDATGPLPFLDGSFDAVVCRFALHHFENPAVVVAEMARCVRPGGHAALVDLLAGSDPALAAEQDRLETLRDPSHTHLLSALGLERLLADHGLVPAGFDERPVVRPLAPWLAQTSASPAVTGEIETALRAELAGERGPTGLAPSLRNGELWFTQTFGAAVGRRA